MSIYNKESYSQSKIVFLAGPIEAWWDTPEEPDKFNSPAARAYRRFRDILEKELKKRGYLVYKPHDAFGGNWNEKAQSVNDGAIRIADILVNMTPPGVKALGTNHEVAYARRLGIPIVVGYNAISNVSLFGTTMWDDDAMTWASRVVDDVDSHLAGVLH